MTHDYMHLAKLVCSIKYYPLIVKGKERKFESACKNNIIILVDLAYKNECSSFNRRRKKLKLGSHQS